MSAADLPGRSGIVELFRDCLRHTARRDIPLTVLLGPMGSGKTWVLKYLWKACEQSVAIPHVFLDCAEHRRDSVWKLVCEVADGLHRQWREFGTLNFPRVTLARLVVGPADLPEDDEAAQNQLQNELRRRARLPERAQAADETVVDAAQALDISLAEARLIGRVVRSVAGSRFTLDALYRTGLTWFASRNQHNGNCWRELVRLNRLHHSEDQRRVADRILVEALLADLTQAYSGGRRRFNCAVLLDNCDGRAGRGLLNLLAETRAAAAECDPLVVVAASRTAPVLSGLRDRWSLPWEDRPGTGRRETPIPELVGRDFWESGRGGRSSPGSWWLPVQLRNLTRTELARTVPEEQHGFVDRLTGGHPWSARRLPAAIPTTESMRTVLDRFEPNLGYLLDGLPEHHHRDLVRWSAARDIDAAAAGLGVSGAGAGGDLSDQLERLQWLTGGNPRRWPRIDPWLRRILLWQLAKAGADEWNRVHGRLRAYAERHRPHQTDAIYHSLAGGDLGTAVDYLGKQLRELDAQSWIAAFNDITAAPGLHHTADSPEARLDDLLRGCGPADPFDSGRKVLWELVAARWIWSDPLGDPAFTLTDTIADGFMLLPGVAQTGMARFHREARIYREMEP